MERDGLTGFELLVLAIGAAVAVAVSTVWGGATLALLVSGNPMGVPISDATDALGRLPANGSDPASAWPRRYSSVLPGPVLYWTCTAVILVAAW